VGQAPTLPPIWRSVASTTGRSSDRVAAADNLTVLRFPCRERILLKRAASRCFIVNVADSDAISRERTARARELKLLEENDECQSSRPGPYRWPHLHEALFECEARTTAFAFST